MCKKTDGLLTIIVPCYNAAKYLDRCFSSLDSMHNEDISILFVNDGSTDRTLQMLEDWTAQHYKAYLVSKDNGGYGTAINTGLDNCGSEYVMFMGVDDELLAKGIDRICQHLRGKQPDILAFSTVKYYDDASPGDIQSEKDLATEYANQGFYETDVFGLYRKVKKDAWILFTRDTSRCFKMSLIGNLRYFGKTGVSADGCFAGLVACRAHSFMFLNEVCYLWHVHKDSVSGSERKKTVEKLMEEADVWAAFFDQIQREFTAIPDPIINHYFVYTLLVGKLRDEGITELASRHEKKAKDFSEWALNKTALTPKSRIKLIFPKLYSMLLEMKNGH